MIKLKLHPAKAVAAALGATILAGACFGIFVVIFNIKTASWFSEWLKLCACVMVASAGLAIMLMRSNPPAKVASALVIPIVAVLLFLNSYNLAADLAFMPRLVPGDPYLAFPYDRPSIEFIGNLRGGMTLKEFEAGLLPEQIPWSFMEGGSYLLGPRAGCPHCPVRHTYMIMVRPYMIGEDEGWLLATFFNGRLSRARLGMGDPRFTKVEQPPKRNFSGLLSGGMQKVDFMGRDVYRLPINIPNATPYVQMRMAAFREQLHSSQFESYGVAGAEKTFSGAELQPFDCKLCTFPFVQWEDPQVQAIEKSIIAATPRSRLSFN
jgi:hypothetical protein